MSSHFLIRSFPKRLSCVSFTSDGEHVLVADRFGDVHSFSVAEAFSASSSSPMSPVTLADDARPLLGHFSTVPALAASASFVASGDRENRIRISCYPRCYDIHRFCMGHTDFITRLVWTRNDLLLSGSGDGSVRLWDPADGSELGAVEFPTSECRVVVGLAVSPTNADVAAVLLHEESRVFLLMGLSSRTVKLAGDFILSERQGGADAEISGLAFDGSGHLAISNRDQPMVVTYKLPKLGNGCELDASAVEEEEICDVTGGGGPQTSERVLSSQKLDTAKRAGSGVDCTPGEWLVHLRKLGFDPGWKGKKRLRDPDERKATVPADGGRSESKSLKTEVLPARIGPSVARIEPE